MAVNNVRHCFLCNNCNCKFAKSWVFYYRFVKLYIDRLHILHCQFLFIPASALRINKLVLQKVLIGHYTNPEDPTRDSQKFCKRTLVVIPYDTPDIGEINVRIYKGEEDSPDYEEFLVENVSTEIAEGLYVEFLKKPRIILLKEDESNKAVDDVKGKEHDQPPPPVPPRPGQKGKDKRKYSIYSASRKHTYIILTPLNSTFI